MQLLRLILEIVVILVRWHTDPARMKQAVDERLEREERERKQDFRRAVVRRDADAVSGMLARIRDRLRNKNRLSGR